MMFVMSAAMGWILVGAAVGFAGMIASPRASYLGLLVLMGAGTTGGIVGALLGRLLHLYPSLTSWWTLATAFVGAVLFVVGTHFLALRVPRLDTEHAHAHA